MIISFSSYVTIDYLLPVPPLDTESESVGVLDIVWIGRPCRIRTCDQWIKSPLLYQLS